jgi:CheY-like chemotaxis protein
MVCVQCAPFASVLITVQDNAVNVSVLTKVLKRLGYSDYETAQDGAEAFDKAIARQFDLVLMDLQAG